MGGLTIPRWGRVIESSNRSGHAAGVKFLIIFEAPHAILYGTPEVDRADFCPVSSNPYLDAPMAIGYGATISAPHMHIAALELCEPWLRPGARVLDVGHGSGYLCVLFSKLMADEGQVVGIELRAPLVQQSVSNVQKHHQALLASGAVRLKCGDGWAGDPSHAPFDVIHVGAAASRVPPMLLKQLKPGGRMLIPVGPQGGMQYFTVVDKNANGQVSERITMAVQYVPLIEKSPDQARGNYNY